ncbi:MAG: glycosyltransferase [Planctomycetaceae bacterium]|jgi:glycosyltransferase involved in cell wall biosynthesis|nr:glycosyltransferase [Planctomycetaceae bacterium]
MPKVSFVIPVWNAEKYLPECLDSIRNQTLRDIEVIAVDDGSPDNCPQILDEYAAKDSRLKVIHQKNAGVSAARNAAYPYLRGEYTLFVDADDWIEPDLCEKATAVAGKEQADMTFFFFYRAFNRRYELEKYLKIRTFAGLEKRMLLHHVSPGMKLWRTDFLRNNSILFPEDIRRGEDEVVHWHALLLNPKTALLPKRMYHYRYNPGSATERQAKTLNREDTFLMYRRIAGLLKQTGQENTDWKTVYLERKLRMMYFTYAGVFRKDRPQVLQRIKKELGEEERNFLNLPNDLLPAMKDFYASMDGSPFRRFKNSLQVMKQDIRQVCIRIALNIISYFWKIP